MASVVSKPPKPSVARKKIRMTGAIAALVSADFHAETSSQLRRAVDGARRNWLDVSAWKSALTSAAIAPVILIFFLATLGFGGFETTLAMLLRDALNLTKDKSFYVFAYVGFVLMLAQGFLYRRLARKLSEVAFMTIGIILMAIGVLALGALTLLAYSGNPGFGFLLTILLIALATAVVGFAFLTPSAQALVS